MARKYTGESARTDEAHQQINADVLRTVFDLALAPLQQGVQEGTVMDCADGKTRICCPILSAWIADHVKHAALHGIGSKSCPKYEVLCKALCGNPLKMYETRNYILYRQKALSHEPGQVARIVEYFQQVGLKIGNNALARRERVNPADLHKLDLLHNIYFGPFKHIVKWVVGFLQKHKLDPAFDDAWKEIPPYPRLSVSKKAYREVTQWQGKEMRRVGRGISARLASALRNPHSSQFPNFKSALNCVSVLVDPSLMA